MFSPLSGFESPRLQPARRLWSLRMLTATLRNMEFSCWRPSNLWVQLRVWLWKAFITLNAIRPLKEVCFFNCEGQERLERVWVKFYDVPSSSVLYIFGPVIFYQTFGRVCFMDVIPRLYCLSDVISTPLTSYIWLCRCSMTWTRTFTRPYPTQSSPSASTWMWSLSIW